MVGGGSVEVCRGWGWFYSFVNTKQREQKFEPFCQYNYITSEGNFSYTENKLFYSFALGIKRVVKLICGQEPIFGGIKSLFM